MKILGYAGKDSNYIKLYHVQCDCGKTYTTRSDTIKRGLKNCISCSSKLNGKKSAKHNMCKSDTYKTWKSMKERCRTHVFYLKNNIEVCYSWKNNFLNFLNDMGERPSNKYTIDRMNPRLGYFPENCRWATWKQQNRNLNSNKVIKFNGKSKCLGEWAEILDIPYYVLWGRIYKYKWTVIKAFTTLYKPYKSHVKNH